MLCHSPLVSNELHCSLRVCSMIIVLFYETAVLMRSLTDLAESVAYYGPVFVKMKMHCCAKYLNFRTAYKYCLNFPSSIFEGYIYNVDLNHAVLFNKVLGYCVWELCIACDVLTMTMSLERLTSIPFFVIVTYWNNLM